MRQATTARRRRYLTAFTKCYGLRSLRIKEVTNVVDNCVSYKSSDRPRAETLKSWFEDAGWSVWIDRGIEIGEEFEPRILHELETARLIAVLWSAEARKSNWVQREAEFAL